MSSLRLRAVQRKMLRWIRTIYRITQRTRLGKAAMRRLERSPPWLRRWIEARKRTVRVWGGDVFVPEGEITEVYRRSLAWLSARDGRDSIGDYLEFGVYIGTSLTCMHRALEEHGLYHVRLFGFDSFQGLPEPSGVADDEVWAAGDFVADYESVRKLLTQQGVDWGRTTLVPGWFEDTLNDDLIERHRLGNASVIMVDCDMYASARTALRFCAPLIGSSAVIIFDDWNSWNLADRNQGEKRAFEEFLRERPDLTATEFARYGGQSVAFCVTRSGT
jgi:O-methyltransferase